MKMASTIICHNCKEKANINNVRYAQNAKDLVCIPCFNDLVSKLPKPASEREKYHCLSCNYKFSFKKCSRILRKCPNCASENIMLQDSVTSTTVLRDVEENPDFIIQR